MSTSDVEEFGNRIPRSGSSVQPRMWHEPFLLLALQRWQSHGYELIRRMATFGFEAIDGGGVYRTLRQLESDGLVSSGWITSSEGPARRRYSLTDAGRSYLSIWAASLRGSQSMLDQFFSLYPPPPAPSAEAPGQGRRGTPAEPGGRRRRDTSPPREPRRTTPGTHDERPDRPAVPGSAAPGACGPRRSRLPGTAGAGRPGGGSWRDEVAAGSAPPVARRAPD